MSNSNILWVEDFGGGDVITTVDDVLGGIIETENLPNEKRQLRKVLANNGITVQLNFQDAISFINNHLDTIDYVILDIDLDTLPRGKTESAVRDCPETIDILKAHYDLIDADDEHELEKALPKLKQHAGFHLYVDLLFNHQYPREKILFCSNHGENLATIQSAFKAAMMILPPIYTKSDNKVKKLVQDSCKSKYAILRRGIIDGCNAIQQQLEEYRHASTPSGENQSSRKGLAALGELKKSFQEQNKAIPFNSFINQAQQVSIQDMYDYVSVLAELLPLQEPAQTEKDNKYKLFIRTLSHEWVRDIRWSNFGSNRQLRAFASIMKNTRNWVMHSETFDHLSEEDVAFLFICNIRAMFDLGEDMALHEKKLMPLFEPADFNKTKLTDAMINRYHWLSSKSPGAYYNVISFDELLRRYQNNDRLKPSISHLIQGLYQLFWFQTSPGVVRKSNKPGELTYSFNIDKRYFDRQATGCFFTEFARHVYTKSFKV
jgi:hypothetical protein